MTVNVLGTQYEIVESDKVSDNNLDESDGYVDFSIKKIVIDTFQNNPGSMEDLAVHKKQVIRHEVVYAFLHESGLDSWTHNEELVNWFAIQFPKLYKAFTSVDAI